MNFHDNLKNKNRKNIFLIGSGHCASFMKVGSKLRGEGVCISLVGTETEFSVSGIFSRWNFLQGEFSNSGIFHKWNFPGGTFLGRIYRSRKIYTGPFIQDFRAKKVAPNDIKIHSKCIYVTLYDIDTAKHWGKQTFYLFQNSLVRILT